MWSKYHALRGVPLNRPLKKNTEQGELRIMTHVHVQYRYFRLSMYSENLNRLWLEISPSLRRHKHTKHTADDDVVTFQAKFPVHSSIHNYYYGTRFRPSETSTCTASQISNQLHKSRKAESGHRTYNLKKVRHFAYNL